MNKGRKIGGIILVILGTISLLVGILFGSIFLAGGGVMDSDEGQAEIDSRLDYELSEFKEDALTTYGEVIDVDEETITVEYYSEVDDYWYETEFELLSSGIYNVGDTIEIWYNVDDPSYAMSPDVIRDSMGDVGGMMSAVGAVFLCIFGIVGLVMLIIGIVLLVKKPEKPFNPQPIPHPNQMGAYPNQYGQPGGYQNQYGQPGGYQNQYGQPGGYQNQYSQPGNYQNQYNQQSGSESQGSDYSQKI